MCNKTSLLSLLLREGVQRTIGIRNIRFSYFISQICAYDMSQVSKTFRLPFSPFLSFFWLCNCSTLSCQRSPIKFYSSLFLPITNQWRGQQKVRSFLKIALVLLFAYSRAAESLSGRASWAARSKSAELGAGCAPRCTAAEERRISCLPKPPPAFGLLLATLRVAVGVEMQGKWKVRGSTVTVKGDKMTRLLTLFQSRGGFG